MKLVSSKVDFRLKWDNRRFHNNVSDYLSWVLSDKSPLHKNCKVHILSNPEYDFWTDMVDKDDGYIGIRTEGKQFFSNFLKFWHLKFQVKIARK